MSDNSRNPLQSIGVVPDYPDVKYYANMGAKGFVIREADPWKETTLSWKESCYIHAGISGDVMILEGPDTQKVISLASINNVYKWPIGTSKHLVMCNADGLISNHGLMCRDNENRFRMFAACPWPILKLMTPDMNVNYYTHKGFIFQIAGPKSLQVLEMTTGESLRDVEFLMVRPTKDGNRIGISSGTTYSYYYRHLISHCSIDVGQAHIGNEVIVHWGDYGKRIKEVRATVERFPYLDLPSNQNYDLSTVPSGIPEG